MSTTDSSRPVTAVHRAAAKERPALRVAGTAPAQVERQPPAPAATKRSRRDWKRLQPTSLRQALELCKEHAREKRQMSVERIADAMGVADHWAIYKWLQEGRIPANLVRPYEIACGIDYVTRWMAASAGKMLVEIPKGRPLQDGDVVSLHNGFGSALQLLTAFYASRADSAGTIAALSAHIEEAAWHRENVAKFMNPELDFGS